MEYENEIEDSIIELVESIKDFFSQIKGWIK